MTSSQLMILFLVILLAAVLCLTVPLLVSLGFLVRKKFKVGFIVLGVYVALVGSFVIYAQLHRRHTVGRILRYCMGAGLARQETEDQVEDLQHSSALPRLQNWAVQTMDRFRSGQVLTNGAASYWSLGDIQLARSEIPQLVSTQWTEPEVPEVSIKLSANGQPEFVVVAWYLRGVILGQPSYRSPLAYPNYKKQATNGVYVYYLYK